MNITLHYTNLDSLGEGDIFDGEFYSSKGDSKNLTKTYTSYSFDNRNRDGNGCLC